MSEYIHTKTLTITGTTSDVWCTNGVSIPTTLTMPAAWDTADITVKISNAPIYTYDLATDTGSKGQAAKPVVGAMQDLYNTLDDSIITLNVSAGKSYDIHHPIKANYIMLVSTASQSSPRVITVGYRHVT